MIGLDHVVVATDDLERTSGASTPPLVAAAAGPGRGRAETRLPPSWAADRRAGRTRRSGGGPGDLLGLVINVEDLDVAVSALGPELISPAKAAVQPGRSIATFREEAFGLPVALMTP